MSTKVIESIYNEFKDMFPGISCFEGTFSLQVKERKLYQVSLNYVAYVLQQMYKEELDTLAKTTKNYALGVDEIPK